MNPILVLSVVLIYIQVVLSANLNCNVPGVLTKAAEDDDSSSTSGGKCPVNKIAQIQLTKVKTSHVTTYQKCSSCASGLTLQYDADFCARNQKINICKVIKNVLGLSSACFQIRIFTCQVSETQTPAATTIAEITTVTTTAEATTTTADTTAADITLTTTPPFHW